MSKLTSEKIKQIIAEEGLFLKERAKTIHTVCPGCNKNDKLSILKANGFTVCYRGSCEFKGPKPFTEWLMATAKINKAEALERINGRKNQEYSANIELKLSLKQEHDDNFEEEVNDEIIPWPLEFATPISEERAEEGRDYLNRRGISASIARKYDIVYSVETKRVIFPVFYNDQCTGWQARTIESLPAYLKVRNNSGFRRASSVMFIDKVKAKDFVIIAEGPVDAIKFDLCGNAVATMGKIISNKQIEMIMAKNPKKVYLALDEDAAPEMRKLQKKISVPLYRISVPKSCKERSLSSGSKADFGECTYEECLTAFKDATELNQLSTILYLKD